MKDTSKSQIPKGFKKVSEFKPLVTFDKVEDVGKKVEGIVGDVRTVKTSKSITGEMTVADIGENAIALSAALLNLIPQYKGKYVIIEYLGMETNPNTKLDFKKFDVWIKE